MPRPVRDLAGWAAVVLGGLALAAVAVAVDARVGTASAPFTGRYALRLGPASVLAPAVAVVVLGAVVRGAHDRLPWRRLLVAAFLAAFGWTISLALVEGGHGLAGPLELSRSYLHDVPLVGSHPGGFLRDYVALAPRLGVEARQHPPGGVLLLWGLDRLGLRDPLALGVLLTAVGCLAVPLVAVATRSLCHEPAARRLLPVLVLAPYALWVAVSLDAVTLTVCAAALAAGVVGSEPGRPPWWAVGSGLLLGVASLLSYSAAWLGASVLVTYFVRRRPLLNIISGAAALVPLELARLAGFVWPDGLTAAQTDFSRRIGPHRSWPLWALLDVSIVAIACGPALAAATRKIRLTPGWPFLVGATLAVGFAILSGLSRGEAERSFLPFLPWLLVPAVAPEPRAGRAAVATTPVLLVAIGALTTVVVEAVLRSPW